MQERILALAQVITGCREEEEPLLEALCTGAEARWRLRLREGVTAEDCGDALCCAAAFTAAADLAAGRGGDGVSSFTAGQVTLRGADGSQVGSALRQAAETLMAPYTEAADFAFRGVRG